MNFAFILSFKTTDEDEDYLRLSFIVVVGVKLKLLTFWRSGLRHTPETAEAHSDSVNSLFLPRRESVFLEVFNISYLLLYYYLLLMV